MPKMQSPIMQSMTKTKFFNNIFKHLLCVVLMSSGHAFAGSFVVSTYPLFLIAQEVTKNIERPQLLLDKNHSGHDAQLSPQQRQMIAKSELVIWLGVQHEVTLQSVLAPQSKAIAILNSPLLQPRLQRNLKGVPIQGSLDSHVWLDPQHALRIGFFIAALRAQQHPKAKWHYFANAREFAMRLLMTRHQLTAMHSQTTQSYWAYHDAYQYLEPSLNLKFKGALTLDEELTPTAAQIKYVSEQQAIKPSCLIAEYQPSAQLIQQLHLKPNAIVLVDESFAQYDNFIQAWRATATRILQCTQN